ncbi:MAG TPA: hypothetical protein VMX96_01360 [Dehalococcoidia bacterium]|nr:hypothetical protein [Dehalococcoidia bacterium]
MRGPRRVGGRGNLIDVLSRYVGIAEQSILSIYIGTTEGEKAFSCRLLSMVGNTPTVGIEVSNAARGEPFG